MKELTIEEKAQRYDKAIIEFKPIYDLAKEQGRTIDVKEFERIFPELKENEDEKIRKKLIAYFKNLSDVYSLEPLEINPKKVIAWLEKQGEQKPTTEIKSAEESLGIDSETYNKIVDECIYGDDEQKPAKWNEDDDVMLRTAKDVIFKSDDCSDGTTYKLIDWLKSIKERVRLK